MGNSYEKNSADFSIVDGFVVGARSGDVYRIGAADARLRSTWNSRDSLRPLLLS